MKKIRKHLSKISLLMGMTLLFFSCSQYDDMNNSQIESGSKFRGQEIFEGLFFFQNDIPLNISNLQGVTAEINRLKTSNSEIVNSLNELSSISVDYINQKYPEFFSELQSSMYSGNLYEIESSLNKSVKIIEQATLSSEKYSKAFILGDKIQNDEKLKDKVLSLDLNNEKDVNEFRNILKDIENVDNVEFAWVWTVAAAVYIVVGAVSFVVVAYSVVTKAAYWDPFEVAAENSLISNKSSVSKEITVAELGDYFATN